MTTTNTENKTQLTLESGQVITLRRADVMHWIRRGQCPKWYAMVYLSRGQQRISGEELEARISSAAVEELYEMTQFHDFLVSYAVNGQVSLDTLSMEDYDAVLNYAQTGELAATPETLLDEAATKGDSPVEALASFRAES